MSMIPLSQTVSIGGEDREVHELTNKDIYEFCKWCREERLREIVAIRGGAPLASMKPAEVSRLLNDVPFPEFMDETCMASMGNPLIASRLVFEALHGKGGTWEEFLKAVELDADGIVTAINALFRFRAQRREQKG